MHRTTLVILTVSLASLVAMPASAKPDYNGLSPSGRSALQSFYSYMKDCDPDAPPHKGANDIVASSGLEKCERVIRSQRQRLDRIKGADRNHKVFVQFNAYQARLEKAYPRWVEEYKARRAQAGELQKTAVAMKKDLSRHSRTLWFLKDIADGKPRLTESDSNPMSAKKQLEAGTEIAALATACTGDYAAVLADKNMSRWAVADRTPTPAEACELASRWKPLFAEWLPRAAGAYAEVKRAQYQGFVDDILKSGKTSDDILELLTAAAMTKRVAETLEAYRPIASALDAIIGDDTFDKWLEVAAQGPKAVATASKVTRPRRKAANAAVAKAVKASLKGTTLSLKKLGLASKDGVIDKSGVGIPLRRTWSGDLLASKKGEKFCRLYEVGAAAPYKGGGRYQAAMSRGPGRLFQVSSCK